MQEWAQHPKQSPQRSPEGLSKNPSFMSQGTGHYRASSREREAKTDRGLPLLHPQLNIGDITYSFKEKISINTAPHKQPTASFNLYARGNPKEEVPQATFIKTAAPHDYRRASDRHDEPHTSYLHTQATKSFDFSRVPAKRPQATATDFYARDSRRAASQETGEPKSRKLLEMMLKRMSRLNVEEEPALAHARSFSRQAQHARTWDNKSLSLDHTKKKMNATLGRHADPQPARRSSRDSQRVFPPGAGSSGAFPQKPLGSTAKSKPIQIRSLRAKNGGQGS